MTITGDWIFGRDSGPYEWWTLRRDVTVGQMPHKARIQISSFGGHALWVNGHTVNRGPVKSLDFDMTYDEIDILPYLREGTNEIEILSQHLTKGGVWARVFADAVEVLTTDASWRARRNSCFLPFTARICAPLSPIRRAEEQYDARMEGEQGEWEAAEIVGKAGQWPYPFLNENTVGELTEDLYLGARYMALGFAEPAPERYSFRFQGESISKTDLYAARVTAWDEVRTPVYCHGAAAIYLNGARIQDHAVFQKGDNELLLVNSFGELELALDPDGELDFSGGWRLWHEERDMTECAWHARDWVQDEGEASYEAYADRLRGEAWEAPEVYPCSAAFQVQFQRFVKGRGGFADPGLRLGNAVSDEITGDSGRQNLCHHNGTAACFTKDVTFILDLEQERLGSYLLDIEAQSGVTVDIVGFEHIGPVGIVWMETNAARYICRDGRQTFVTMVPHGCRYLSVTLRGIHSPVAIYRVGVIQRNYPAANVGEFFSDSAKLNEIFQMSVDTAKLCMQDTYIDCPGYEQVYWTGDAKITSHVNLLYSGGYEYDQRCIHLLGKTLRPEFTELYKPADERYRKEKNLVLPTFGDYVDGGLPMWSFMWVMQCWDHYWYGGNEKDLAVNFQDVRTMLEHALRWVNDRGLMEMTDNWDLLDWADNDLTSYGESVSNSAWLARCCVIASAMADDLGLDTETVYFKEKADSLRTAINALAWDPGRSAYVDTVRDAYGYERYTRFCGKKGVAPFDYAQYLQLGRISRQTNTILYVCGCVPPERRAAVETIILDSVRGQYASGSPAKRGFEGQPATEFVEIGSPMFLYYTFEALGMMNRQDLVMETIEKVWGFMLQCGTKTCWETFPVDAERWTRSICHAWSASPAVCLLTRTLGVEPMAPGFRKFRVALRPGTLTVLRGSVATPYGPIYVRYEGGALTVDAPRECELLEERVQR